MSYVEPSRIALFYNSADVYIHPSLEEGASFPLLEALASGVPIIASNVPPIPEITGECAILHAPTDLDGFAASALALLTDEERRRNLSNRAQAWVKSLTWQNAARKTLQVYNTVLEGL